MKKVKYTGELDVMLPTIGVDIKTNDIIEVEDDFNNDLFVLVEDEKTDKKKGDK